MAPAQITNHGLGIPGNKMYEWTELASTLDGVGDVLLRLSLSDLHLINLDTLEGFRAGLRKLYKGATRLGLVKKYRRLATQQKSSSIISTESNEAVATLGSKRRPEREEPAIAKRRRMTSIANQSSGEDAYEDDSGNQSNVGVPIGPEEEELEAEQNESGEKEPDKNVDALAEPDQEEPAATENQQESGDSSHHIPQQNPSLSDELQNEAESSHMHLTRSHSAESRRMQSQLQEEEEEEEAEAEAEAGAAAATSESSGHILQIGPVRIVYRYFNA